MICRTLRPLRVFKQTLLYHILPGLGRFLKLQRKIPWYVNISSFSTLDLASNRGHCQDLPSVGMSPSVAWRTFTEAFVFSCLQIAKYTLDIFLLGVGRWLDRVSSNGILPSLYSNEDQGPPYSGVNSLTISGSLPEEVFFSLLSQTVCFVFPSAHFF